MQVLFRPCGTRTHNHKRCATTAALFEKNTNKELQQRLIFVKKDTFLKQTSDFQLKGKNFFLMNVEILLKMRLKNHLDDNDDDGTISKIKAASFKQVRF